MASCSTWLANCGNAGLEVKMFGFDIVKSRLYYGDKEKPERIINFSELDEKEMLAISLSDWNAVRAHCHVQ